MRTLLRAALTGLAMAAPWRPADAEMSVYHHTGSWDAFSGTTEDGKPVCGVGSTNPVDNRAFSMRFQLGTDVMSFQAKKPSWTIPENTQIPVVVQLGSDTPWAAQAVGNGQTVEWTIDRTMVQGFDLQFRRGTTMTVAFPSGNEPPWTIGLNGSTAISNAFGRCVNDMVARARVQQPATPSGPTQPFGQEPTQPNAPRQ